MCCVACDFRLTGIFFFVCVCRFPMLIPALFTANVHEQNKMTIIVKQITRKKKKILFPFVRSFVRPPTSIERRVSSVGVDISRSMLCNGKLTRPIISDVLIIVKDFSFFLYKRNKMTTNNDLFICLSEIPDHLAQSVSQSFETKSFVRP